MEDFKKNYSCTRACWLVLSTNLRTGRISLANVFLFMSGRIMKYSGVFLLADLALKLVSVAVFGDMPVRADTLKTDPVLHQEVFALFIAKPLELLTVIHCMGLHLVIEVVCTRVRWSGEAWLLRGW